ncbi:MAG: glycosyltransferase family 4 protein [Anaerolineae bacterium]|nr:glycosyltransferase family 4 protein [Anaerolineae bacterium]
MSRPLRVLLVVKSTGGVAEYIRWLIHGIDREKFSFTVACLSENGREFASELRQIAGVQTYYYEIDRYNVDLISDTRVGLQLMKLIRSHEFDLVHAHASKPGFLTRIAAIGTGVPVLYSPHCFAFHAGAGQLTNLVTSSLENFASYFTTRIITVADGERDLARKYRVGRDDQFTVIHTGIDPTPYRQSVDKSRLKTLLGIPLSSSVIGSVGRLSEQKSPFDFVRLAEAVHRSRPDAHFIWLGDGPLEDEVRKLSNSLHLDSIIHWLGHRNDVPQLLHIFDCFVLTSRWEGFPLVILEAMAADVPVVATNIPGTCEAIRHEINGLLATVGDSETMAHFVLDLLADPVKANSFRAASRSRIDTEFTRDRMLSMIRDLYLDVASNGSFAND